jgi:hypothetical protein
MKNMFNFQRPEDIKRRMEEFEAEWGKSIKEKKELKIVSREEKFIIDKVLSRNGVNLLVGYTAQGKTWLVLFLVKKILEGKLEVIGGEDYEVFGENKIFYINAETPETVIAERIQLLDIPYPNENFNFVCRKMLDLENENEILSFASLLKVENYNIVILDPLRAFFSGDENKSSTIRRIFTNLKKYFCEKGISVILVHHLGKPPKDKSGFNESYEETLYKFMLARGSSDIGASSDIIFVISKLPKTEGFEIRMKQEKNVYMREIDELRIDFSKMPDISVVPFSREKTLSAIFEKELREMFKNSVDFSLEGEDIDRVAQRVGISEAWKFRTLRRLREEGYIEPKKKGRYTTYYWVKPDKL